MTAVAIGVELSSSGALLVLADRSATIIDARRLLAAPTPADVADAVAVLADRAREPPVAVALTGADPDVATCRAAIVQCMPQLAVVAVDGGVAAMAACPPADGARGRQRLLIAAGQQLWGAMAGPDGALQPWNVAHQVVQPRGLRCTCGRRGCLETVAGLDALARWERLVQLPPGYGLRDLWSPPSRLGLIQRARDHDLMVLAVSARVADALARTFASRAADDAVCQLVWPHLAGDDALVQLVSRHLRRYRPEAALRVVAWSADLSAAGAAALAVGMNIRYTAGVVEDGRRGDAPT